MKPLTIFLPGMLSGQWFWQGFWRAAGVKEYSHTLQLPGLYCTAKPHYTFSGEVRAYTRLIKKLAKQHPSAPVILVAHSYGAQHALALAKNPTLNIQRLVLVAPALGRWWMLTTFLRLIHWKLKGNPWRSAFTHPTEQKELENYRAALQSQNLNLTLQSPWPQFISIALRLGRGLSLPKNPKIPLTILQPSQDKLLPWKNFPPPINTIKIEGGHFLFLAKRQPWQQIQKHLR